MSFVNYAAREICCKIVYYGPGLGGKTANVQHIFDRTAEASRGRLISLKTESDRTLFFDFLPIDLGRISGYSTRLQLYTVPGQVHYRASRRLILRGVDGIVFVADSQRGRLDADAESMADLAENLAEQGQPLETVPLVIQYNKRDLDDVVPVDELGELLNPRGVPELEASAAKGIGVFETLRAVGRLALTGLKLPRR
jgi:signal recognition particle receptor subunit beta